VVAEQSYETTPQVMLEVLAVVVLTHLAAYLAPLKGLLGRVIMAEQ
jgi:hypothetical protein